MKKLKKELKPCSCGCKRLWIITYKSFFKTSSYVECTNCNKRTKSFIRIDKAIQEWNNKCDGILQEKIHDKVEDLDAR